MVPVARTSRSRSESHALSTVSSPPAGSSSNSKRGRPTSARATDTSCRCPCESSRTASSRCESKKRVVSASSLCSDIRRAALAGFSCFHCASASRPRANASEIRRWRVSEAAPSTIESIVVVHPSALLQALGALFESLWARALPLPLAGEEMATEDRASRDEATTRNRRDERDKNHNRIGSSGQRCGDSESDANAKLRAEPA